MGTCYICVWFCVLFSVTLVWSVGRREGGAVSFEPLHSVHVSTHSFQKTTVKSSQEFIILK